MILVLSVAEINDELKKKYKNGYNHLLWFWHNWCIEQVTNIESIFICIAICIYNSIIL